MRAVYGIAGNNNPCRITFLDAQAKKIDEYSPKGHPSSGPIYSCNGPHEDIIGVYGVKDEKDFFSGFGFLVRIMDSD